MDEQEGIGICAERKWSKGNMAMFWEGEVSKEGRGGEFL